MIDARPDLVKRFVILRLAAAIKTRARKVDHTFLDNKKNRRNMIFGYTLNNLNDGKITARTNENTYNLYDFTYDHNSYTLIYDHN